MIEGASSPFALATSSSAITEIEPTRIEPSSAELPRAFLITSANNVRSSVDVSWGCRKSHLLRDTVLRVEHCYERLSVSRSRQHRFCPCLTRRLITIARFPPPAPRRWVSLHFACRGRRRLIIWRGLSARNFFPGAAQLSSFFFCDDSAKMMTNGYKLSWCSFLFLRLIRLLTWRQEDKLPSSIDLKASWSCSNFFLVEVTWRELEAHHSVIKVNFLVLVKCHLFRPPEEKFCLTRRLKRVCQHELRWKHHEAISIRAGKWEEGKSTRKKFPTRSFLLRPHPGFWLKVLIA